MKLFYASQQRNTPTSLGSTESTETKLNNRVFYSSHSV